MQARGAPAVSRSSDADADADADVDAIDPSRLVNLTELVTRAARAHGDRPALVDRRRRLTWSEVENERRAVAAGLARLGLVAGSRVALLLGNRVELVTTYLAALGAGLVAVPLNPASVTGEAVRALGDCSPRVLVCERETVDTARAAVAGLGHATGGAGPQRGSGAGVPRVVVVDAPPGPGELGYGDVRTQAEAHPAAPRDPETLAALLYTAGTGGRPRTAMLPHRALLANVEQAAAMDPPPLDGHDRVLGVLPMFHVYGLNAVLGQVLRQAACLVLTERFEPEETLALIEAESVTNVPVAPPALSAWAGRDDLRRRLRGVRTVLSGASPLAPEVARGFEDAAGIAVHQGYGLTEAAPVVASTLATGSVPRPGSVGRALPGVDIRIADDSGTPVDDGDPGELRVRGDNLFLGYWPDGHGGPDTDGWYATGDVGYVDATGDLFLVDRLRDVVIVSGFNVYPVEVEQAIGEVAGVAEVAVIGVPEAHGGERVVAYVVPEPSAGLSAAALADAVRARCAERLAGFKRPREVHVVDQLPHSVSGKVAKGRLRDRRRRQPMGLA